MRKALIPAELKTMQRLCSKLRSLAAVHSSARPQLFPAPFFSRLLHSATNLLHKPLTSAVISPNFNPHFTTFLTSQIALPGCASFLPLSFMQVRYVTLKQRKRHAKVRRPSSPIVSKVKKIKMKTYSSYKGRFRTMNDGQIRRWREGTRHNAHLKFVRYSEIMVGLVRVVGLRVYQFVRFNWSCKYNSGGRGISYLAKLSN